MIINDKKTDVSRINTGTDSSFRIKTSAKAIKILSTSIYQNPKEAVVREYATNAYDAHIAAGIPETPFTVHFPTKLEPYYSVRDYGYGLSEDHLRSCATTYFDSDKNETNALVGGLGLGFKSAFSMTDSFSIVSYYEGIKRSYVAFIAENGLPSLTAMGEASPTDEQGLEVTIPVKDFDFEAIFRKIFYHFPVAPKVIGAAMTLETYKIKKVGETELIGDTWRIVDNFPKIDRGRDDWGWNGMPLGMPMSYHQAAQMRMNNHQNPRGGQFHTYVNEIGHGDFGVPASSYVRMGVVAYPIDLTLVFTADQKRSEFFRRYNVIVDVPVGALEIMPGREGLSYDSDTVAAVEKHLAKCYREIKKNAQKVIDSCETMYEAIKAIKYFDQIIRLEKWRDKSIEGIILKECVRSIVDGNYAYNARKGQLYLAQNNNYGDRYVVFLVDSIKKFKEAACAYSVKFRKQVALIVKPKTMSAEEFAKENLQGHPWHTEDELKEYIPAKVPKVVVKKIPTISLYSVSGRRIDAEIDSLTPKYYIIEQKPKQGVASAILLANYEIYDNCFSVPPTFVKKLGKNWFPVLDQISKHARTKYGNINLDIGKTFRDWAHFDTLKNFFKNIRNDDILKKFPKDIQEVCEILIKEKCISLMHSELYEGIMYFHKGTDDEFAKKLNAIVAKYEFIPLLKAVNAENATLIGDLLKKYDV